MAVKVTRIHLLPFRTEKLSSLALMVLRFRGRVKSCQLDSNYIKFLMISNMTIKKVIQKGSLWIQKTPRRLLVCVLTVLIHITLLIGNYQEFQSCPCSQHAEEVLDTLCSIEETLYTYNESKTMEYERRRKRRFRIQ